MKTFILPILFILILISCKKEVQNPENMTPEDSINISENDSQFVENEKFAVITELNPTQTTDFLKPKKNDTLYVTNFFATWCGPCVREIPHFKEKMIELKDQPVKFTFISLDSKDVWQTKVQEFVDEHGIRNETILLDGKFLGEDFFEANFKTWRGETIPFTLMRKGDKTEEIGTSISKEELEKKLNSFN